jgi:hypothetical protein
MGASTHGKEEKSKKQSHAKEDNKRLRKPSSLYNNPCHIN